MILKEGIQFSLIAVTCNRRRRRRRWNERKKLEIRKFERSSMLTWTYHVSFSADMARYVSRSFLLYQRKMKEIVPSKNNIVPPLSRETVIIVENIQNITQCSEAVQTLFECSMDPHEAVLLILEKGSFQEVKCKQKKKKEMHDDRIKNATGLCSPYSCRTSTLKDAAGLHSPFPSRTSSLTRGRGGGFVFYQSTSPISPFLRDPGPQKTNSLLFAQPEFAPAKNLYPCFACPEFGSFTLNALKMHNKMYHPCCKDRCNLCYNVFDTNEALLAHKQSMSHGFKNKIKIFLCVHCGSKNKTYTTMRKLRTHTWAKHGRFNYRCKLCRNLFETGRAVSVHTPSCVCAHGGNVTEEDGGSDFSEIDENVEESGEISFLLTFHCLVFLSVFVFLI